MYIKFVIVSRLSCIMQFIFTILSTIVKDRDFFQTRIYYAPQAATI